MPTTVIGRPLIHLSIYGVDSLPDAIDIGRRYLELHHNECVWTFVNGCAGICNAWLLSYRADRKEEVEIG